VRTPAINLYGQLQYDHKQLDDAIGASDLHTDRHLDNGTASVAGMCAMGCCPAALISGAWTDSGRVA